MMRIAWCGRTHICGRPQNEDSFGAEQVTPRLAVFAVADGLGGLPAGEVASRIAVDTLIASVRLAVTGNATLNPDKMQELLDAGFLAASDAIRAAGEKNPELAGMATTLVAALINDNAEAVVAHAGDSRAYLAGTTLSRLTTDHSLVQEMVTHGLITQDDAGVHPDRNVVTRVVSHQPVHPDFDRITLRGETLLLCSDGLLEAMTEDEIFNVMRGPDPDSVCSSLIERAAAARHDNTTVIIVRVSA